MINKLIIRLFMICLLFIMPIMTLIADEVDSTSDADFLTEDYDALMDDFGKDGDTHSGKQSDSANTHDFVFSMMGDHRFDFNIPVMKDNMEFEGPIKSPRFHNELGIEIKYKFLELVSHWQLDLVINDSGDISKILLYLPLENSIVLKPWKFRIGVGYQYITWGTADKYNPTDNVNPFDYTVGGIPEKLSALSATVEFQPINIFSVEAVYLPFVQNSKFPRDFATELHQQLDATVDTNFPAFDPSTFVVGGKLNFYFSAIDFSFSYLYDYDNYFTPEFDLVFVPGANIYKPFSIKLTKKRVHHFGADFKTSVDRVGMWGEINYTMSEDYLMDDYGIRNHQLSWATGFDISFGPDNKFYLNFQYFGDFNPNFDNRIKDDYKETTMGTMTFPYELGKSKSYYLEYYQRSIVNKLGGVEEGLSQGVALALQFPFSINSMNFKPELAVSYMLPLIYDYDEEIRYGNLFVKTQFTFTPIDSLDIILGADIYLAWSKESGGDVKIDETEKLGVFYGDSHIYLSIKYQWAWDYTK